LSPEPEHHRDDRPLSTQEDTRPWGLVFDVDEEAAAKKDTQPALHEL
jgi:hypothetical protein